MRDTFDKRQHARVQLKGYIADVADGHLVYAGTVADVSLRGLRLTELPERFCTEGKKYTIIVSGEMDPVSFKLKVYSRWRRRNGITMDVGFSILEAPVGWRKFVQKISPKQKTVEKEDDHNFWDTGSSRD